MSASSRAWISKKRSTGIADLGNLNYGGGSVAILDLKKKKLLSYNARVEVGIATETEVGLSEDRYPICVRIVKDINETFDMTVDTVIHYWPVVDATGAHVPFSRRPDFSSRLVERIYQWVPNFDELAWEVIQTVQIPSTGITNLTPYASEIKAYLDVAALDNPDPSQIATATDAIRSLFDKFRADNVAPTFQLSTNRFILCVPHGTFRGSPAHAHLSDEDIPIYEYALTVKANYLNLSGRYSAATDGTLTAAASIAASAWRWGFLEAHEHHEVNYVNVTIDDKDTFTVVSVDKEQWVDSEFKVGQKIKANDMKFNEQMIQLANGMMVASGINHYLYNHTTGGTILGGTLYSMALMYKLFDDKNATFTPEDQTSMYYEACHPVNKRLVANLLLKNSKVVTAGRSRCAHPMQVVHTDTFMNIRTNPYPAGSHKAFIMLLVLQRVARANLAPFLPWAAEINSVIDMCHRIMSNGSRSHVGSGYYTGYPPIAQGSDLDNYLPEMAAFMNTLAKSDTLTLSPHLAPDIAARSSQPWQSLLNKIKSEDISATDPEVVKQFLTQTGAVMFSFDPTDQSTWAAAATASSAAANRIANLLADT